MIHIQNEVVVDTAVLGQRIRQARDKAGLSQEEFANAVGKDQRAISEYESGKRRVAATDLTIFARVLEVPVVYFYEGTPGDNPLDQVMLQEFHQLPTDEARHAAIQVIRVISNLFKSHSS